MENRNTSHQSAVFLLHDIPTRAVSTVHSNGPISLSMFINSLSVSVYRFEFVYQSRILRADIEFKKSI